MRDPMRWTARFALLAFVSTVGSSALAQETAAGGDGPGDRAAARRFATREGSTGGLFLVDPSSGREGSVRLQLLLDSAPKDDFLLDGSQVGQGHQALSVSVTPLAELEVFAALKSSGTTSDDPSLGSLHAQSAALGLKTFTTSMKPVHLGADLRVLLHNELGGQLPLLKATSVGLRGLAALDLGETEADVPLRLRAGFDYLFDNAILQVEDTEDARYADLADPRDRIDETRHLVTRFERYGLGLNRVDQLTFGLGAEAPLALGADASLHPLLEWKITLPINRRGFDCVLNPSDDLGTSRSEADGCVSESGLAAFPSQLGLGVRVVPPVRGLSLLLGVEIGVSGTSTFVQELTPTSPLAVVFALAYQDEPEAEAVPPASPPEPENLAPPAAPATAPVAPPPPAAPATPPAPAAEPSPVEPAPIAPPSPVPTQPLPSEPAPVPPATPSPY